MLPSDFTAGDVACSRMSDLIDAPFHAAQVSAWGSLISLLLILDAASRLKFGKQ